MIIILKKHLTKDEALKQALKKYGKDARGFTYNPKTGRATII